MPLMLSTCSRIICYHIWHQVACQRHCRLPWTALQRRHMKSTQCMPAGAVIWTLATHPAMTNINFDRSGLILTLKGLLAVLLECDDMFVLGYNGLSNAFAN
eukprot:scaffold412429_cov40-Prasinocladus_malaysianus.AAC.2